jgi:hypothetical protein
VPRKLVQGSLAEVAANLRSKGTETKIGCFRSGASCVDDFKSVARKETAAFFRKLHKDDTQVKCVRTKVGCIESCATWVDDCESVALRDNTISFIRKRCEDDTENTGKDF